MSAKKKTWSRFLLRTDELATIDWSPLNSPALSFSIPGRPVGKGRPVFGAGRRARTPEETLIFEQHVRHHAVKAMLDEGWEPLAGRAFVEVHAYWDETHALKSVPDADNVAKAVIDAIQGQTRGRNKRPPIVFANDSQVTGMTAWRHLTNAKSCTVVQVKSLDGEWRR